MGTHRPQRFTGKGGCDEFRARKIAGTLSDRSSVDPSASGEGWNDFSGIVGVGLMQRRINLGLVIQMSEVLPVLTQASLVVCSAGSLPRTQPPKVRLLRNNDNLFCSFGPMRQNTALNTAKKMASTLSPTSSAMMSFPRWLPWQQLFQRKTLPRFGVKCSPWGLMLIV